MSLWAWTGWQLTLVLLSPLTWLVLGQRMGVQALLWLVLAVQCLAQQPWSK